jgi:hypothetical protein
MSLKDGHVRKYFLNWALLLSPVDPEAYDICGKSQGSISAYSMTCTHSIHIIARPYLSYVPPVADLGHRFSSNTAATPKKGYDVIAV